MRSGPLLRIGSHQSANIKCKDTNSSCEQSSSPSFEPHSTRQATGLPNHQGSSEGNDTGGTCSATARTGDCTGSTSTPIQRSSSNRGKSTAAKYPSKAPKCEYCKDRQKKGGEIFRQHPELIRRCPAYANLSVADFFCKSCALYLQQIFIRR